MSWLLSLVIAILDGCLGCVSAGYVAYLCVDWYRVTSREGAAGYFILSLGLLGGLAGCVLGLILARVVGGSGAPGFLKGLGVSAGVVVGLAGLAALISWALADIPPKIQGRILDLLVEIRLPVGEAQPATRVPGDSLLILGSVSSWNHVQRASWDGKLDVEKARLVDGRWIVPGSVFLFTTRGARSIALMLDGKSRGGFIVPLPGHPGHGDEQWSEWLPKSKGRDGPPWPDTEISYRYRVERRMPPPPPPDPRVVEAQQFAALKPDAPLADWLRFLRDDAPPERLQAVMQVIESRPADLATAIRSADDATAEASLHVVPRLTTIPPEVADAVLAVGHDIADGIRRLNALRPEDGDGYALGSKVRSRFGSWHPAWWSVHQKNGLDGRPPVQEILDLALTRPNDVCMDDIIANARAHLEGLKTAETKGR
jgi:hypothetical protein